MAQQKLLWSPTIRIGSESPAPRPAIISDNSHCRAASSPAGTYHVHARVYAQKAAANFIVYSNVNSSWKQLLNKPVADGQTLTVDSEITIPEGCQHLLVRMQLGREVGLIGMMSQILIESADTYDKAVGGGLPGFFSGDTMPRD